MATASKANPVEVLLSKFRATVDEMEAFSMEDGAAEKVRQFKLLRLNVGAAIDLCEKLEMEVDDALNKLYETATLATDSNFGDDALKRRVEALVPLAEDFGIGDGELVEIGMLVDRYIKASDAFQAAVEPVKERKGKGSKGTVGEHVYTNNRTEYKTGSLRGMKKHLTGVLGEAWKSDAGIVIYEDGAPVKE